MWYNLLKFNYLLDTSQPEYNELPFMNQNKTVNSENDCINLCYKSETCIQAIYFFGNTTGELSNVNSNTCFLQTNLTIPNAYRKHINSNVFSIKSKKSMLFNKF